MVRTHALMEAVSASLHEFLHTIDTDLTKPQKKFLRDGVIGLLRAGRPIVCAMARKLPDQRTKFLSRLDRLEDNLNRQSAFDQKLKAALPALWLPLIRNETPIILDLSEWQGHPSLLSGRLGDGASARTKRDIDDGGGPHGRP